MEVSYETTIPSAARGYWGDKQKLHEAIAGEKQGGVGPGLTPNQALQLGLKVDQGAIPAAVLEVIKVAP